MLDEFIYPIFFASRHQLLLNISVPAEEHRRNSSLFCISEQRFALREANGEKGNVISINL